MSPKNKVLTGLKRSESYISMVVGLIVVILIVVSIINFFAAKKGNLTVPGIQAPELQDKSTETDMVLPTKHTVQIGESLWKIAVKYYNSGYNWVTLAQSNKLTSPDVIWEGQELIIPQAQTIRPIIEAIPFTQTRKEEFYTVVKGDSLWKIAVKQYGNGYGWVKIARENRLTHPDVIFSGTVLKIPN